MPSYTIIFVVLIIMIIFGAKPLTEQWTTYIKPPFNHVATGQSPLAHYAKYRYRLPYRYPFTFYKSYPFPHQSHLE
jgi:hypothetical protein